MLVLIEPYQNVTIISCEQLMIPQFSNSVPNCPLLNNLRFLWQAFPTFFCQLFDWLIIKQGEYFFGQDSVTTDLISVIRRVVVVFLAVGTF